MIRDLFNDQERKPTEPMVVRDEKPKPERDERQGELPLNVAAK